MLVNGASAEVISIRDRGLLYGDGVFRTLPVRQGRVADWLLHLAKLQHDCVALGISCPDGAFLEAELQSLLPTHPDGVYKIVVTRGIGQRGYAPSADALPTHFWDVTPLPNYPSEYATHGIAACFCQLRLSEQPRLAGIKHLNRLENVLAAAELGTAVEGLLRDAQGHVIEGTRSNLFWMKNGQLCTPDLSRCGVAGVQRQRILAAFPVSVGAVDVAGLLAADEVFVVNSLIGVWSIRQLGERTWQDFSMARHVRAKLQQEEKTCSDF